jgi:hypothetical protein
MRPGITDTINVAANAAIGAIKVTLDITHMGIVKLTLKSATPGG